MRFLAAAPLLGFATIALLALSCSGDKAVYLKFTASVEDPRVAPGSAPQRLNKPYVESAAPDSVLPPAPNSLLFVGMIFVVGCLWACASNMLVLFGCCSRNRAAALASVVPSPSEGAPSGQPQQEAFTEVPDALKF